MNKAGEYAILGAILELKDTARPDLNTKNVTETEIESIYWLDDPYSPPLV